MQLGCCKPVTYIIHPFQANSKSSYVIPKKPESPSSLNTLKAELRHEQMQVLDALSAGPEHKHM